MKTYCCIIISIISLIQCVSHHTVKPAEKSCIYTKTDNFKTTVICTSSASVDEYVLDGSALFAFNNGHCGADIPITYYNSECVEKCSIGGIGGITGDTSFANKILKGKLILVKNLWKN